MKQIYIIGASGFASEVSGYIQKSKKWKILGYFDTNNTEYDKYGFNAPLLGNEDSFNFLENENVVIAISNGKIRCKIYNNLKSKKLNFVNIIHDTSIVSQNANIKEGAILCPFVTITSNANIGINFQANIYSYVAHDCIIGDNVTFAPAVKCNGNVIIQDNVYIGTGTIIHQGKRDNPLIIGANSQIAAGSVITKSVPPNSTFFGNPAIPLTKENLKRRT